MSILHNGRRLHCYHKQRLPNAGLFDEKRQFSAGDDSFVFTVDSVPIAPAICQDIWETGDTGVVSPQVMAMKNVGAKLILSAHGSPYHPQKPQRRLDNMRRLASATGLPIISANLVGGQDNFVFDGASTAVNSDGSIAMQAPQFTTGLYLLQAAYKNGEVKLHSDCRHSLPGCGAKPVPGPGAGKQGLRP